MSMPVIRIAQERENVALEREWIAAQIITARCQNSSGDVCRCA
jgi:hypothetical protein